MENNKKFRVHKYIIYALIATFVLIKFFMDGVNLPPDAESYLSMASFREPMYPLFLALCRVISESHLSVIAVLFQNLLFIVAVCYFLETLYYFFRMPDWLKWVLAAIPTGVVFFCKNIMGQEYWFINGIQSEGISISIWLFFGIYILRYLYTRRGKYLALTLLMAGILYNTRKQLVICFLIIGILGLGMRLCKVIDNRSFWKALGCVVIAGILTLLVGPLYHLIFFDDFQTYTDTNSAFLTPAAYCADREMGQTIENQEVREIFYQTYDKADGLGYNYKYADGGWERGKSRRIQHYEDSFNKLAFGILRNDIKIYVQSLGISDEFQQDLKFDELEGELAFSLIPHTWKKFLPIYWDSVLYGLIFSVAKPHSILTPFAFVLLIIHVLALVSCYCKGKKKSAVLGSVALLSVMINALVTSLFIFPLARYMVYNIMLVYCSLLIMISDLLNVIQERNDG